MELDQLIECAAQARAGRANWDTLWQDIADRVLPQMADFTVRRTDGERRTEKMFDATAALAAQRALAACTSFFWPSNQRYQRLTADMPKNQSSQAVDQFLDDATDILFKVRYSPRAAFEAQMSEAGLSFLVFGTGILFIDDMLTNPAIRRPGILYKSVPYAL